jgi:hypothetical protein
MVRWMGEQKTGLTIFLAGLDHFRWSGQAGQQVTEALLAVSPIPTPVVHSLCLSLFHSRRGLPDTAHYGGNVGHHSGYGVGRAVPRPEEVEHRPGLLRHRNGPTWYGF